MVRKLREKNVWIYAIITLAIFKLGQEISDVPLEFLYEKGIFPTDESAQLFFGQFVADLIVTLLMLILLWRTQKLGLLKKKGTGFFKGLKVAAYPIGFSIMVFTFVLFAAHTEKLKVNSIGNILIYVLCMLFVGLSEELCSRMIIAQSFVEHCGINKTGIWKAAILSGFLFGCLHLFNLEVANPLGVIVQCIVAGAAGVTYAAIYFRTGNIWILVFVHTLNDLATGAMYGFFNSGNMLDSMSAESGGSPLFGLIMAIPEVITFIYLLRDKKIDEIKNVWE